MNLNIFCRVRLILVIPGLLLILSGCAITEHVDIRAPVEDVWKYVNDSRTAGEWSVYFHHISPLPGIQDGKAGSLRRCFRRADESEIWWDEQTVAIELYKYRKIRAFNTHGFTEPHHNEAEFEVLQSYQEVKPGIIRLTFSSRLLKTDDWFPWQRFWIMGQEGRRVFTLNLENIKTALEQGEVYKRVHPYEEHNRMDPKSDP